MTTRVAVFRPDDERMRDAISFLESLGVEPVADPMLTISPTGATPREDADDVIFTSTTGVGLLPDGWDPGDARICAIGPQTAAALEEAGIVVDLVPETYSSSGLVNRLGKESAGRRVEVARSDHGSDVLLDGLEEAGAYLHETVLYRLERPSDAGTSTAIAAEGDLDAALFSSSLTVEHFLEAAAVRGIKDDAIEGLDATVVGTIGHPTAHTAREFGINVDVVPPEATFEALAQAVVEQLQESTSTQG